MGPPDVGSKRTTYYGNLARGDFWPLWGLDIFVEVVDVFHRVPSIPLFQPIWAGVKSFEVRTNLYELGVDRGEIKIRTAETPVNPLPDVSDR